MSINIVQHANNYEASNPTGEVTLGSPATAGDTLVGFTSWASSTLLSSTLSDSAGNTWVTKASGPDSGFTPSAPPTGVTPPVTVSSGQSVAWITAKSVEAGDGPNNTENPPHGSATATLTSGAAAMNAPGPPGWGMMWSNFQWPTLPPDAVIDAIYPVIVMSGDGSTNVGCGAAYGTNDAFSAGFFGVGAEGLGFKDASGVNMPGGTSPEFSGQYHGGSLGTTAGALAGINIWAWLDRSLTFPLGTFGGISVDWVGMAVYYTSASQSAGHNHTIGYALDCLAGSDTLLDGVSGTAATDADHNLIEVSDILKFDSFSGTSFTSSPTPINALLSTLDGSQYAFTTSGSYDNWFAGLIAFTSPVTTAKFKIVFAFVSTSDSGGVSETVSGWTLLHNGPFNGIYYSIVEPTLGSAVRVFIRVGNTRQL